MFTHPRRNSRMWRRLATEIAAVTSLALVCASVAAADPAPSGPASAVPDGTLPAVAGGAIHPLAVPGSTPERRAALEKLGPNAQEKLAAALAGITSRPLAPDGPTAAGESVPWQDLIGGKVDRSTSGPAVTPRFTERAPTTPRNGINADGDTDGLDDGFESAVADAFTPVYHVSANEHPFTGFARFADAPTQAVVELRSNPPVPPISHFRVQPLGFGTTNTGQQVSVLRVDYLTLWNWDDGLDITSACRADLIFVGGFIGFNASMILEGLQAHEIDNERSAALLAAPVPAPGVFNTDPWAYSAYSYYTAGHEGTFTDTSAYFDPSQPVPAGWHINLAHSRAKHATYTFNPDFYPLIPAWLINLSYATVQYLYDTYQIDWWYYLALLALLDGVFFLCFVEHFTEMGGYFADPRINVGEPGRPINGSSFIADGRLAPKLTVPLW
jgi:hypothetical protein